MIHLIKLIKNQTILDALSTSKCKNIKCVEMLNECLGKDDI